MAENKHKQHVRDLVEIRIFIRELIESERVGRQVVGEILRQLGFYPTLEGIYSEELNNL